MLCMQCTRLDIAQAVSVVSRYMYCPRKTHWQAVKWILKYLQGTSNSCLEFTKHNDTLIGFEDSDYVGIFIGEYHF